MGRHQEAVRAYREALRLAPTPPEQRFLARRAAEAAQAEATARAEAPADT
jgi:predicted RNA polymerase sigma factor